MASKEDRGRAGEFWPGMGAALQEAGFALSAACGELKATIHQGRVTKVHLGLEKKTTTDSDDSPPEAWAPIYGTNSLSASFQTYVEALLADTAVRFGEVTVQFSNGSPNVLLITRRFLPGEHDQLDQMLDTSPSLGVS